ncbi:MAG: leucyl/phenylalanyl-tRNA--protein transferase [Bdellovibrionales bacterium]|jgi:leucyl/phenylalanyl-tRNA--protein transferase|nr:leucyl/phenylalanyl-tRNA--protein transferase [Bdellovibrionales bacterium]
MRVSRFPDPREAGEEGIVAVGGDLDVETLVDAYTHGIFPWPQEGLPMLWFSPKERGVIDLREELRASASFLRRLRAWKFESLGHPGRLEVRIDTAFADVMRACQAASRPGQNGTWILPEMVEAYERLHRAGLAHSVETYLDGELVGGLYGVFVRGVFSGESMFHKVADAGKVALWTLLELQKKAGFLFIDVQMVTPVVASFGGKLISRDDYLKELELAHDRWDRKVCRFEWVKGPVLP